MSIITEKWGVIVNPHAGRRKLRKDWIDIYRTLKRAQMQFSVQTTEYPGHAESIANDLVETGFRKILIVGGDGTINEVINGVYKSNIDDKSNVTLAVIPYGTGNDWARYWNLYRCTRNRLVDILCRQRTTTVDVGSLLYSQNGERKQHFFLNGAGLGYDGKVVDITNRLKGVLGGHAWVYSLSVLLAIFRYRPAFMRVKSGSVCCERKIYSVSVGNGCYSGGGLKMNNGDPTDGKLFVTLIGTPNLWQLITGLIALFKGKLYEHSLAQVVITDDIVFSTEKTVDVEADGVEISGDGEYNIKVIPAAVKMVM